MSQNSMVVASSSLPMTALATFLDNALNTIETKFSGSSAPTTGPGSAGALVAGQDWLNTTSTTYVWNLYDGASWVPWLSLNTSAHTIGMTLSATTASTSTTTGALIVAGGVGIGGSLYVGDYVLSSVIAATTGNPIILNAASGQYIGFQIDGTYYLVQNMAALFDNSGTLGLGASGYPWAGSFYSTGVYNSTTASAANVFVASSGLVSRSTSSLRYKTDVRPIELNDALPVLELTPIRFRSLAKNDDHEADFVGLAAEEVARHLPEFVFFDDEGRPDGVQYDRVASVALLAIVKSQHARIAALEASIH